MYRFIPAPGGHWQALMVPPLGPPCTTLVLCLQSLPRTCPAITRLDPDLRIDFLAWPWTCLITMDLLAWGSAPLAEPGLDLWACPSPSWLGSARPSHVLPLCCWWLPSLTAPGQSISYFLQFFLCFRCLHRQGRNSARSWKRKDGALIISKTQDSTWSIKITWIQGSFSWIFHYLKALMNHTKLSLQSDTGGCCLPFKKNRKTLNSSAAL